MVIGSDSGFESDVLKLRTKSLEVSNTRQGQSVLVAPCYTLLSSARPFSYNEAVTDSNSDELQPEIHTRLPHDEIRDNPSEVSFAKGIFNLYVFFSNRSDYDRDFIGIFRYWITSDEKFSSCFKYKSNICYTS